ncbi:MAG: hypothetical protein JWR85_4059 [Marmoricola sp.]|nr:hypothetical protein [Marmoricola sp.]
MKITEVKIEITTDDSDVHILYTLVPHGGKFMPEMKVNLGAVAYDDPTAVELFSGMTFQLASSVTCSRLEIDHIGTYEWRRLLPGQRLKLVNDNEEKDA